MIFNVINRLYKNVVSGLFEKTWWVVGFTIAILYFGGLLGMMLFGEVQIVENFTWWFSVTITTVGYGDYSPVTSEGRLIAGIIMFVGIGVIGLVIGKLAEKIIEITSLKRKGLGKMLLKNHTIIAGYRRNNTEKMVAELLADNPDKKIVLCSSTQDVNPISGNDISFVRGEMSSTDVLKRSNAAEAENIIIHGKDDDQTFFTAYAFREVNKSAHMVCCLQDEDHADKIKRLPANDVANNQVVLPANIYLMAQELQDNESCAVIQDLISNLTGDNMYRFDIKPDEDFDISFKDLFYNLKEKMGITVIALKDEAMMINPSLDTQIKPGMALFYAGPKRIESIDFKGIGDTA